MLSLQHFFFPSLFFHVQVSTAYNWQPIDGLNEKEKRWEEKCISISGGVDIRNHRGMLDFIIHLVWGYLRQKKEKREANKLAVCKRSIENNHDSSFCLWEPCLNFYVETVSNNTGKLCIHILFVHRKNTTFTGCKPFFISLFVYKIYFKRSN